MPVLALRDAQLHFVMKVAATLPIKQRAAFLECLADQLRDGFTDAELVAAMREAAALVREPA
jgi:hypothetical protein